MSKAAESAPRVLTLDIECAPATAHVWELWENNVSPTNGQLITPTAPFAFAAKWHDERRTAFYSDHSDGHEAMIRAAWEGLEEADVVVSYNGVDFDVKSLNTEFLQLGLAKPSPYKHIDLLRVVRANFRFMSNRLDFVARELGLGRKTKHPGFELWRDCMAGDEKAWALMEKYNRQDVRLTEQLFDRLQPWITQLEPRAMRKAA